MRVLVVVAMFVGAAACATPRLDDPPLAVEIVVTGLRQDERVELRDRVCTLEGVRDCLLVQESAVPARKAGRQKDVAPPPPSPEARIAFSYRGSLGALRYRIAELPHPGLEARRAQVRLAYRGFDNKAPAVQLLEPVEQTVVTQPSVRVAARVPDVDTAAVSIGDEAALKDGDVYSATVEDLREGDNVIVVKATDHAGNAAESALTVVVDTTPPGLEVEVVILAYDKATVKGKVTKDVDKLTIDGRPVAPDMFGSFEKDVAVDPDKTTTEVVATDKHGNSRRIKRSAKVPSAMSDASK